MEVTVRKFFGRLGKAWTAVLIVAAVAAVGVGAWALVGFSATGSLSSQEANAVFLDSVTAVPIGSATCTATKGAGNAYSIALGNMSPGGGCTITLNGSASGSNVGNTFIGDTLVSGVGATQVRVSADECALTVAPNMPFAYDYTLMDAPGLLAGQSGIVFNVATSAHDLAPTCAP